MLLYEFENAIETEYILVPTERDMKAGTPLNRAGEVCNNSYAVGILLEDLRANWDSIRLSDGTRKARVAILTKGYVDKNFAQNNIGYSYNSNAITAMSGITFVDGKLPVYTLPAATTSKIGGVKKAANVAEAAGEAPTAAEYKNLLDALKTAGIMVADAT